MCLAGARRFTSGRDAGGHSHHVYRCTVDWRLRAEEQQHCNKVRWPLAEHAAPLKNARRPGSRPLHTRATKAANSGSIRQLVGCPCAAAFAGSVPSHVCTEEQMSDCSQSWVNQQAARTRGKSTACQPTWSDHQADGETKPSQSR